MESRKFLLSMLLTSLFVVSCSTPNQKIIDTTTNNDVPTKLNSIIQKEGQLSEENINITVYKSVYPSVVGINTTSITRDYFSFNEIKGTGSGVIISKNGYILTNYHVVDNAKTLEVTLSDKSVWPAKQVGGDKDKDVAVIKIEAPAALLTAANLGNSDSVAVGEKVLAIGSPYGLFGTLTTGIISSLNRNLPAEDGTVLKDIIQTDAAINPGNSGGPLINSKGEIIGINTAIFSPNGGSVGIGFAIPINKVKETLKNIQASL
ncbi:MAG: trypsin-like peptidase domain-containing protein [Candidatus Sericytochromatia bacterium]|nr:trypsin-like peptidase domain-containing protein [Candidatus Sericytochromatia bacterium]